jgi:hypothetical protein
VGQGRRAAGTVMFARRSVMAAAVAALLVALVACDLAIAGFSGWWDRHTLTASVASNLLVLAVAALIVDAVVARRQRSARATTVAVQAMIVYAQARRAYDALLAASGRGAESDAADEMRMLASMLLTASPSLFDDPDARLFLERVQQLAGAMYRAVVKPDDKLSAQDRDRLTTVITALQLSAAPLIARLPHDYSSAVDEPS